MYLSADLVCGSEVEIAVVVEIGDGDVIGVEAVIDRCAKGAVSVAEEYLSPTEDTDHEVGIAVMVEVGGGDGDRVSQCVEGHRLAKGPVAFAEQQGHGGDALGTVVGDGKVEVAVTVEVRDGDRVRLLSTGVERHLRCKGAVAPAEKDADGSVAVTAIAAVGHRQVGDAVAVEISGHDTERREAGGVVDGGQELGGCGSDGEGQRGDDQSRALGMGS